MKRPIYISTILLLALSLSPLINLGKDVSQKGIKTEDKKAQINVVYKTGEVRKDTWDWPKAMKEISKKFKGRQGKFVPFGDSITYFHPSSSWALNGKGKNPEEITIFEWMKAGNKDKSNGWWLATKNVPGRRSMTAAPSIRSGHFIKGGFHGLPPLEDLLKDHKPQMAWIMLGTNDLSGRVPVKTYLANMEAIYNKCLEHGTIPIAQTVLPTTWDRSKLILKYNEGIIRLAAKLKIPMIDNYGEFLKRRPGETWLKTLISKDGAHPTSVLAAGPATKDNLNNSGYLLRSWLGVHKAIEIKKKVID